MATEDKNVGKWTKVVDEAGEKIPAIGDTPVPLHWIGTDLLPAGAKAKGKSFKPQDLLAAEEDEDDDTSAAAEEVVIPEGDVSESWTRKQLDAKATQVGVSEDELKKAGTKGDVVALIEAKQLT